LKKLKKNHNNNIIKMTGFLTIIILLACVGLILFVLVQNPKGGGLNAEFGSAVQLGGAKRATDILEKGTWTLAIGIAVICLFMATRNGVSGADAITDGEFDASSSEIEVDGGTTIPTPTTLPPAPGAPAGK
jgi:preprotein translocase subunit SecG